MTSKKYEPFSGVVCERIRNLVNLRTKCEAEKKRMFGARDNAASERARLNGAEPKKAERLLQDYGQAVMELERLKKTITWCNNEITEAVEKADQTALFSDADVHVPDFRPGIETEDDEDEGDEGEDKPKDLRPVGRAGKKPAADPDPNEGTGVNQHMSASVHELDLNEQIKGKLVAAGFPAIYGLTQLLEDKARDPRTVLDLNENQMSAVKKSLAAFRSRHTQAIESEFKGVGGTDGVVQAPKGTRAGRGAGLKIAE